MKVIYLNEIYRDAVLAHGLDLKSMSDVDTLHKHFSYEDVSQIVLETEALLETLPLKRYGFVSAISDNMPVASSTYVDNIDSMRKELSSSVCDCVAVDSNTVVLYAYSNGVSPKRGTIENVFNALALIMPVNAVMQTGQYQQYILQ